MFREEKIFIKSLFLHLSIMHFMDLKLLMKLKKNKNQTRMHRHTINYFWNNKNKKSNPKNTLKRLNNSLRLIKCQILRKYNHLESQFLDTAEWIEESRLIMYLEWHMQKQEEWQGKAFWKFNRKRVKLWKRPVNGKSEISLINTKLLFFIVIKSLHII